MSTRIEVITTGYRVMVTAGAYVRHPTLPADRVAGDAHVHTALVTLLPGETATFDIRTGTTVGSAAFLDPLVLRSANQPVTGPGRAGALDAGGANW